RRGGFVIGFCKSASPQNGHPEVLKIIGGYAVPGRPGLLAWLGSWMAGYQDQFPPVVGERVVKRQPRSLDPGQAIQARLELPVERRQPRPRVGGRRIVQADYDAPLHLISEILALELVKAARQHGGPRNQNDGQGGLHNQERLARER